jgi:hypothetical protein
MHNINLDNQQFHTVIAALRFYQEYRQGEPSRRSDWIHELATDGGNETSLDGEGIDVLVNQINTVKPSDTRTVNGVDISVDTGVDGTKVVFVDTPGLPEDFDGPLIRLYLNDEPVFENPPLPDLEEK